MNLVDRIAGGVVRLRRARCEGFNAQASVQQADPGAVMRNSPGGDGRPLPKITYNKSRKADAFRAPPLPLRFRRQGDTTGQTAGAIARGAFCAGRLS